MQFVTVFVLVQKAKKSRSGGSERYFFEAAVEGDSSPKRPPKGNLRRVKAGATSYTSGIVLAPSPATPPELKRSKQEQALQASASTEERESGLTKVELPVQRLSARSRRTAAVEPQGEVREQIFIRNRTRSRSLERELHL